MAYVVFPEGTLWKANREGSNRMQFTQPPVYVVNPRWSPDSKEIVFQTLSLGGHASIRRISVVDGTPQWLLPVETAEMNDREFSASLRIGE